MFITALRNTAGHSKRNLFKKSPDSNIFHQELDDQEPKSHLHENLPHSVLLDERILTLHLKLNDVRKPKHYPVHLINGYSINESLKPATKNKVCPECQVTDKKNAMRGRETVPYLNKKDKIKIFT